MKRKIVLRGMDFDVAPVGSTPNPEIMPIIFVVIVAVRVANM